MRDKEIVIDISFQRKRKKEMSGQQILSMQDKQDEPPRSPAALPRPQDEEDSTRAGAGTEGGNSEDDAMSRTWMFSTC